jgi:hypothetical protein
MIALYRGQIYVTEARMPLSRDYTRSATEEALVIGSPPSAAPHGRPRETP